MCGLFRDEFRGRGEGSPGQEKKARTLEIVSTVSLLSYDVREKSLREGGEGDGRPSFIVIFGQGDSGSLS